MAFLLAATVLAGCGSNPGSGGGNTLTAPTQDVKYGTGFNFTALDAHGLPVPVPFCPAPLTVLDDQGKPTVPAGGVHPCNFLMTPDEGRQGNEVTIAVNPANPREVVGGAKDYYPADAGQCVWDGVYVSHNGGRTPFEDRSFDGSPWRQLNSPDPNKVNYATQYWCTTDPVAYFGQDGKLYYLLMAYQGDPVTASKTCENVCPQGAVNDFAFNRAIQIVAVSDDGGSTFQTFTGVFEGSYPIMFHDKGWLAASADGTIHVIWLASELGGNLYFRSTDHGQTYSATPTVLSSSPSALTGDAGQGSFVDVGPGPQVYAAWTGGSGITLRTSTDEGANWGPAQYILQPHGGGQMPTLSDREQSSGFPAMATDRYGDSPFANSVYFAFNDGCQDPTWNATCKQTGNLNVYVVASHDGGKTFGKPVRVNDDVPDGGKTSDGSYHWMPAVSVSPGGVVDVQWMDTRENVTVNTLNTAGQPQVHPKIGQFYSYSLDGGKTWSHNVNVREPKDGGWDPAFCHHQDGKIFYGDYQDIDSSWQAAHPVWPDTRDGATCKVYTATMQRPWFAEGWDTGKRADAEKLINEKPL